MSVMGKRSLVYTGPAMGSSKTFSQRRKGVYCLRNVSHDGRYLSPTVSHLVPAGTARDTVIFLFGTFPPDPRYLNRSPSALISVLRARQLYSYAHHRIPSVYGHSYKCFLAAAFSSVSIAPVPPKRTSEVLSNLLPHDNDPRIHPRYWVQ